MGSLKGPVDELMVELTPGSGGPLQEQLEQALRAAIRTGRLAADARLPSSRGLAARLGISRGVVTAAYSQLAAEGYLATRQGAPVRVSGAVRGVALRPAARSLVQTFAYDLRPGLPDAATFPRERWLRALGTAWRRAQLTMLGEGDPRGAPPLRDALAAYLDRVRGTAADPEHLLVCSGARHGLTMACGWLRRYGLERVAVEDPGWHPHRLAIEQAGLEAVAVGVDASGLDVSELEATGAEAVIVTPAHQFPSGAVLAPERRTALIDWAETHDRLIIEDDYDGELRFEGTPVGALQGLAPERVLYLGSASKRLAPGLRLGWMLLPSWLTWPLVSARAVEDGGPEALGQLALGELIAAGELDRHLRRMRTLYARRRAVLLRALAEHLPQARAGDDPAGLHELVTLGGRDDEAALLAAAARRGVGLDALSWHSHRHADAGGLVIGYGGLAEPALARAVELLAEASAEIAA